MTVDTLETKFGNARINHNGYYQITSKKEGNNGITLHRLIFEDFYKTKIPKGWDIHHEDGNPLNNEIWNLVPMTHEEHMRIHMTGENNPMHGKPMPDEIKQKISNMFKGEGHPRYRHDISADKLLQEYENSNVTQKQLAEKYNCSVSVIYSRLKQARENRSKQ